MSERAPELWGGVECTLNRVGDRYFDQVAWSGHERRPDDLDRFAALGLRRLRHPVLWERAARGPDDYDWGWIDDRLTRARSLRLGVIAGLVHHGSGPAWTSLADPGFPYELAGYARRVAERYPWLDAYTPVNEPLTTARFSGLYGHWYPHARDAATFARCLLNQCRATVLAMRAIREVNPDARLIQTEDLGKTFSTPGLAYQARFENERRWVTFDLLAGRLSPGDRMWRYFRSLGVSDAELGWFRRNPCPPDVLGVNHYLTSERFLDQRLRSYPPHTWGGNGRHAYADVEAVRVRAEGGDGLPVLLREAWERYRIPIAVTEVHNGCTRDEQLRWFREVWDDAIDAMRDGVDVRAVTAWALLGSFDWNSLVTVPSGHYEPGVFDVRSPAPRPTALAHLVSRLAGGAEAGHPVLDGPGWWRRPQRLTYGGPIREAGTATPASARRVARWGRGREPRPLLITGATGTLGRAFARICEVRGISFRLTTRAELDAAVPVSVRSALETHRPWAVVNTAGYVRVDEAEGEPERCVRENTDAAAVLAESCATSGIPLVTFSSDLVFGGGAARPYVESDLPDPLNAYGRSKAEAERRVLDAWPGALVIRTSAFFGPWDEHNFVTAALRRLTRGETVPAAGDTTVSPTYVPDLVNATLDLLIDEERGIWHLANVGAVSWAELARLAAATAGLEPRVEERTAAELGLAAARPRYSVLGSERGSLLPPLENALVRYAAEIGMTPPSSPAELTDREALEA